MADISARSSAYTSTLVVLLQSSEVGFAVNCQNCRVLLMQYRMKLAWSIPCGPFAAFFHMIHISDNLFLSFSGWCNSLHSRMFCSAHGCPSLTMVPEGTRDLQWGFLIPSLPYGFKLSLLGISCMGNSQEIPRIWEFPKLWIFPVLWEFPKFPPHRKYPFSKCTYIRFQIHSLHFIVCLMVFLTIYMTFLVSQYWLRCISLQEGVSLNDKGHKAKNSSKHNFMYT